MDIKRLIEDAFDKDKDIIDFFIEISSLYSETGNIDKAINIKELLLALPINKEKKEEVMLNLAKDFHRAGMYDNAISVLEDLFLISDNKDEILDMQSHLYSELKEWKKILDIQKMKKVKDPDFILFALCNFSKEVLLDGDLKKAQLLLKEAELISKDHPHILLHWVDVFVKEDNCKKILEIGEKISKDCPDFFGIFLEKVISLADNNFDSLLQLVINHLRYRSQDYYTIYILSGHLFKKERFQDVVNILKGHISKELRIPALIKLFIQSLERVGGDIDKVYLKSIINNIPDHTKWFRCSNCGQEVELYSFNCIRCSSINSLKHLW
ncbi:MAG: hypothetical protein N2999_00365 [Proteobacteria bacterium]|nr:hypothetical protein [Pseudomonadota bacterium]